MEIAFALPPYLYDPDSSVGRRLRGAVETCARKVGPAKLTPGAVTFGIDGAFHPHASSVDNAIALRALLDCLVEIDSLCLEADPNLPPLYLTKVRYRLMPSQYPWDTTPTLYKRGYGDCKSLASLRIAEIRRQGGDAVPVFRNVKNGWGTMYHILLWHADGSWECPSKILGMQTRQEQPRG